MKRILIVGRSGSGKTTFSDELGRALGRKVIHLDNLFWKTGWERAHTSDEWVELVGGLAQEEEWILDGNYHTTLEMRLKRADAVVFFNINPSRVIFRALKRKLVRTNKSNDHFVQLHREVNLFKLVRTIFKFPTKKVTEQIKRAGVKHVYVIKNKKDLEKLLEVFIKGSKILIE